MTADRMWCGTSVKRMRKRGRRARWAIHLEARSVEARKLGKVEQAVAYFTRAVRLMRLALQP